jgi:Arc/MetJ family transcription regulator
MRTTLELDDALVARAKFLTGHDNTAALVHEALTVLIEQRESARRLARLGGTEPQLRRPPRRRPNPPSVG